MSPLQNSLYHLQQVVWNLLLHYRLDIDLPSCGIERIAYVIADHRAEGVKSFQEDLKVSCKHLFEDLVWNSVDPRRRICLRPPRCSPQFFESEEFFTVDHAGTLVLSLKWIYLWKHALRDVLDLIGIVQARSLSSSHQSLGNYFEGDTPWVLFDFTNQDFPALKSASLYALPQKLPFPFPTLTERIFATLHSGPESEKPGHKSKV